MSLSLLPVLSRAEIERIHEHSLDLLERVGIDYRTPKALAVLEERGCPVDYARTRARLPRAVVEWALQQAPRIVRLEARDPQRDVVLDGRRSHHTTDSQGTRVVDFETGAVRASTAEDLRHASRFADALDRVEIVTLSVAAQDAPDHLRTVAQFGLAFTQTGKHVRSAVLNAAQVPVLIEMVQAVTGSATFRPVFSATYCTISPLMHDGPAAEAAIELAKLRVPVLVYPMPLAGGTAPVTLSGAMLVHNVEFLSGLVLLQAVNPGTPVIYGAGAAQLNLQTGEFGNSADGHRMRLGLLDLARFYNLPGNLWGLSTASARLDAQYGHEATATALLARLAGADEIYSIGLLGDAQILSLDKMVLDNHLARQVENMVGPVPVDEAHLQADLIERVGIGGHFLAQRETRDFTRREYVRVWPPPGQDLLAVVHEEALAIYHQHQPPPLPEGAEQKLESILAEADQTLAGA